MRIKVVLAFPENMYSRGDGWPRARESSARTSILNKIPSSATGTRRFIGRENKQESASDGWLCPFAATKAQTQWWLWTGSSEEGRREILGYICLVSLSENYGTGRRDVGKVGRNPWTTSEIVPVLKLLDLCFTLLFFEQWYQNSVSKDRLHSLIPSREECLTPSFS